MNIVKFEFKRGLKTTIIWTVAVTLAGILYTAMGPIFIEQSEVLLEFMQGMGEEFLAGMGINFDNFFTAAGFFSYIGGFLAMALCVQAMIYGIKALALEKNTKSLEFLYTKPSSRLSVYTQKYAANIMLLVITETVVITTLYLVTDIVYTTDYDHTLMLKLLLTFVPLQMLFFSLGTLVGAVVTRLKNIVAVALGATVGMYFLNVISDITGNEILGYGSFFNYYNLSEITLNGNYDTKFVIISLILICGFMISGAVIFKQKDMKVL